MVRLDRIIVLNTMAPAIARPEDAMLAREWSRPLL
jgi:hypothetical protein